MLDIWSFLLQTLNLSGVAVLILLVKAIFKDKLTPKWQFAVFSVLGLMVLIPAGIFGGCALFPWQIAVEYLKSFFGEYGVTRVYFPFPLVIEAPKGISDVIFLIYVLGVAVIALGYVISYFRLRCFLRRGSQPSEERMSSILSVAEAHGIRLCPVVEIYGLHSAFVCGVIRPVLAIPTEMELDEKIILHELFHLKNRDTLWSVIICAVKALHWCNPLIHYSADRALNDMESRCDQYVLESLEGEERREYGGILLSMANERYSRTAGSTCINNGGKNIRVRIENIARFKKYPRGMKLVSVCVIILLAFPLGVGAQTDIFIGNGQSVRLSLASARCAYCTTPAGAFDAYGRSVLERNGYFRAMCAPEEQQRGIQSEMLENNIKGIYPIYDPGLEEWADRESGYYLYNLRQISPTAYEGLFTVRLAYPPDGRAEKANMMYLAVQSLRVEKEKGRWVAIPLEEFRHLETAEENLRWGCMGLPGVAYSGQSGDMAVEVIYQTVHTADRDRSVSYGDSLPAIDGEFTSAVRAQSSVCTYLGEEAKKSEIREIALSTYPVYSGEEPPEELKDPYGEISKPGGDMMTGSSSDGAQWAVQRLSGEWSSEILMYGGGGSIDAEDPPEFPNRIIAELYLNGEKAERLELTMGGETRYDG